MLSAKDLKEQSASLNILYVEDEAILREGMQATLGKLFQNLYIAKNGQEAFELYKKEHIDIVLTDINMPIMNGIELIQSIETYGQYDSAIVVLSAHNESRLLTTLIDLGVDGFLNKPVDKQKLINVLHKVSLHLNEKYQLAMYEKQMQIDLESYARKNKILEQKINQLAASTNTQIKTRTSKELDKKEEFESYYTTLLHDDIDELRDLSEELDNFIAMMFQGEVLNEAYLHKLSDVYKKYAAVLSGYTEFTEIGMALRNFSISILLLGSKFLENIEQTGIYFESLQLTLENFRLNVWDKEAKEPRFYNASLLNDIQLVIDFLEEKEIQENEIEFF